MPGQDRFWLDDGQRRAPAAPHPGQPDPHEAVHGSQPGTSFRGTLKHADLVAQSHVLQLKGRARTENRGQGGEEHRERNGHRSRIKESIIPFPSDVLRFSRGTDPGSSSVKVLLQRSDADDRHYTKTYSSTLPEVYGTTASAFDGRLELFLISGKMVCALFHYQLQHPVTVPIGFISKAPDPLSVAEKIMRDLTRPPAHMSTLTKEGPAVEGVFGRKGTPSRISH